VCIVHRDDAADGHQGRAWTFRRTVGLSDTSIVVMTVSIGSLMSQSEMPSGLPHASYHRSAAWREAIADDRVTALIHSVARIRSERAGCPE
jgi:hypothetical protein